MSTILVTAFEPYDEWSENASWLALVELTRHMPPELQLVTRKYPVDFSKIRSLLARDLEAAPRLAIHLGQAPGASRIALEAVALNVRGHVDNGRDVSQSEAGRPIVYPDGASILAPDGPPAYRSRLPLAELAGKLNAQGVPSTVSFHAGTFLCNACLYWSMHLAHQMDLPTRSLFLHIPLAPQQVAGDRRDLPSMTSAAVAGAIGLIAAELGSCQAPKEERLAERQH